MALKDTKPKEGAPKKATVNADGSANKSEKPAGSAKTRTRNDDDTTIPVLPNPYPPKRDMPDKATFDRQFNELKDLLTKKREEMRNTPLPTTPEQEKLDALIAAKKELDAEINKLVSEIKEVEEVKSRIGPLVKDARAKENENLKILKSQATSRAKPHEIDTEIMRLEIIYQTSGKGGRQAEQAMEKRIAELRALRASFDDAANLQVQQDALREDARRLQEELAVAHESLGKLIPQRHALYAKRDESKKELDAAYAAVREARSKTQTPAQKEIAELDERMKSLKASNDKAWEEYKAFSAAERLRSRKEFLERQLARAKADEERAARNAARDAARAREEEERKAKDAERRKAEIVKRLDPFHEEAAQCEKLVEYLVNRRSMGGPAPVVVAGDAAKAKAITTGKAQLKAFKKEDSDDDVFEGGSASAPNKDRKPKAPGGLAAGARAPAKQPLRHSPQILVAFKATGVDAPATFDGIEAAIEATKARKAFFESKRRTVEEIEEEDRVAAAEKAARRKAKQAAGEAVSDDEATAEPKEEAAAKPKPFTKRKAAAAAADAPAQPEEAVAEDVPAGATAAVEDDDDEAPAGTKPATN